MSNYSQHFSKPLLLLLLLLAIGRGQELEPLQRSKRTLTTICVEIKPSGPLEEPYFMCKGADFSPAQPVAPDAAQQQQPQPINSYPQTATQAPPVNGHYAQAPFPSFPSFGAGFFPMAPGSYDDAAKAAPSPTTYPIQPQSIEGGNPAANYQSGPNAAYAPPSPAQPYGLSAVPYPGAGGTAAASRGTAAGAGPATASYPYADAAAPQPAPAAQTATQPKPSPTSSQAGSGNAYEAMMNSRQHAEPEEQRRAMEPMVGAAPPFTWVPLAQTQLQQPTAMQQAPPYYDDPIMRTFYASLEPNELQVAQAVPMQQTAPLETMLGQAAPTPPGYAPPSYGQSAAAPQQQQPPTQPTYNDYSRPSSSAPAPAVDAGNCNSCNRPCPAPVENSPAPSHCPSFQPVIIAMPCYGQQQPSHYLAMPGSGPAPQPRESVVSSPYGAGYGMAAPVAAPFGAMNQQLGSPFGLSGPQVGSPFGMTAPPGSAFSLSNPQLGSSFGMGPQVGAPFGMSPMLNPFGPFGNLNPFNPFNRLLGSAAPPMQQPRLRLFGAPQEQQPAGAYPTATSPAMPQFTMTPLFSSTAAPAVKSAPTEPSVGTAQQTGDDAEHEDDEDEDATETTHASDTTDNTVGATQDTDASKSSAESKDLTAEQLIKKGEEKLKSDKRKRHNSRSGSNSSQKKKYLQRI